MRSTVRRQENQRARRLTAFTAVVSLLSGALAVGVAAPAAAAEQAWSPTLTVQNVDAAGKDFVLAGEDVAFQLTASNPSDPKTTGGPQFNLSVFALLPASVSFVGVDGKGFEAPKILVAGDVLPNRTRTVEPTAPLTECSALGLVNAPTVVGQPQLCAVPDGQQVWIWSDVNDLPQGAAVSATVTVRPDRDLYPVGSRVGFAARAFTSNDPTRLPTYDGSPSVARTVDHTSGAGIADDDVPVRALRVTKNVTEGTVESELLRGVHDEAARYTVTVRNTTRGATDGVIVTDYLPAGLEYLGLGAGDNTTGAREYPGARALSGGAVGGETVETVRLDATQAAALKLSGAGVYTKVTWTLGTLASGATRELTYRAAVPLFENELWAAGTAPAVTGAQAANLDNNTGASTRHGGTSTPQDGQSLRNLASASGSYTGAVLNGDAALRAVSDSDSETVEAVDVRVAKSVDTGDFATGRLATYSVTVDASEYTDATAVTLTDVIPNGLCPAFPIDSDDVALMIDGSPASDGDWNDEIPGGACTFPTTAGGAVLSPELTVRSIDYHRAAGTFEVVFTAEDIPAGGSFTARYSAMQRISYTGGDGGTSSGDSFVNRVTVTAETESVAAIAGEPTLAERVGGTRFVSDGSSATIASGTPTFTKTVLQRGQTPGQKDAVWAKDGDQPFSPGDDVWYRVEANFATGIDTRNAQVTDYLPEGVRLVETLYSYRGMPGFDDETSPTAYDGATFPSDYLPQAGVSGNALTWHFGSRNRAGSDDKFMPAGSTVTMYVHAQVTGQSATRDDVDSPRNHAKYQQVNVHGDIWFDRDDAGIDLDWGATLAKGIRTLNGQEIGPDFADREKERTVVQGDRVGYRLDVTAPQNTTTDYVVWDVLPTGVLEADLAELGAWTYDSSSTASAKLGDDDVDVRVYNPGDELPDGISLRPDHSGRAVVVWTVGADVDGTTPAKDGATATTRGLSLGYTLTVPTGAEDGGPAAQLTQRYVNDAGLVSYAIRNSPSATTTVVPQREGGGQQLTNRTLRDGEVAASDIDTYGSATVVLPDLTVGKKLLSTEVSPDDVATRAVDLGDGSRNTAGQIVQGEYATFEYSVTIPAKTSVRGAVISDGGMLATDATGVAYQYVSGSAKYFGPGDLEITDGENGFRTEDSRAGTSQHGILTFPDTYTNSTEKSQTFRVQITVWVKDQDAAPANSREPQIANQTRLTNTATVTFYDPNDGGRSRTPRTATADVTFIEPEVTLAKVSSTPVVQANGEVTYTLTASNTSGRPALYDVVVIDCVPAQIVPGAPQASVGTARVVGDCAIASDDSIQTGSGTGKLIEWTIPEIRGTGTTGAPTLTYTGTVQQQAGGGSQFTNRAELTGYTLRTAVGSDTDTTDRRGMLRTKASATVRMPDATMVKSVSPAQAPVGSVVTYTVTTTLPAQTNFYDVALTDLLPAGVEFLPTGTATQSFDWAGAPKEPSIGGPALSSDGKTLTWPLGATTFDAWKDDRTITVTFQARLTPAVVAAKPDNRASFTWKKVDGSTVETDRVTATANAQVTILNPDVRIAKAVKLTGAADSTYGPTKSGNPDQSFTYRVRVTNANSGTAAYGIVVTDQVSAGVRIDTTQSVFAGAEFDNETAIRDGRGGRITWTIPGPFTTGNHDLVYQGTFAASDTLTATASVANTAAVAQYASATTGGWQYLPGKGKVPGGANLVARSAAANVTPLFPSITLKNAVSKGTEAFVGESFSWTLTAVNAGKGSAQTVTLTDLLPVNWAYDPAVEPTITIGGKPVTADVLLVHGETADNRQTLTWTIGSPTGAPLLLGSDTGVDEDRTIRITFSAKPLPGAVTNSGAGMSHWHGSMLSGSATDTSGITRNATASYVGANSPAAAQIARADLEVVKTAIGGDAGKAWLAGAAPGNGYTQPQWLITITNQGPDAASGPFVVRDTLELPAGVTTGTFSARYFPGGTGGGQPLSLTGSGTASDPFVVGLQNTVLNAAGTDRIELVADVAIPSAATGTARNTADATGRTFEDPADLVDNTSAVSKAISSAADLSIEKSVTTTEPTAGRPITWAIRVVNNGPSVAASTSSDAIIVTDTIPDGVSGVQDPSADLTAWTVTASDGWPASAGDTVTWTYTGTQLAVGLAQDLSLRGTVDSSWVGGSIRNTAVVEPGPTTDPVPTNNAGQAVATPGDGTTLAVTKTRVVRDGDVWKDAADLGEPLPEVVAGETISYRVVVTNNGPADARGVRIVDEVPGMLSFASVEGESGTWTRTAGPGTEDTFALTGTIPASATDSRRAFVVTYGVSTDLAAGSVVENWVRALADNARVAVPPRDGDTTDSERIADLSIVKQALDADGAAVAADEVAEVTAGTQTRFRLTVTNDGPSVSGAPIVVTDRLPAGMTLVSSRVSVAGAPATSVAPVVSDGGRTLTWTPVTGAATLAAGATIVVEVTAAVAPEAPEQRLVNAADVTGADDRDPSNNHSEVAIDVVTLAALSVVKDVATGPWIAGTDVTYTITVDNDGPSVADAFVADVLPAGLTAVSITGEGWDCDRIDFSCLRAAHPLGESTITVVARVASGVPTGTELVNTADLSWTDSRTTSPHRTSDTAAITVSTNADLRLVKTAVDEEGAETTAAVAGENARYRIAVDNLGPSDAIGPLAVVDALPAGVRFVGLLGASAEVWTSDADDADPQTVTFTLLPQSAGVTSGSSAPALEFEVAIDAAVANGALLTNTAGVSSGTPDATPANDSDTADLTVARAVDLSITKTHDASAVRIGDVLPFSLQVGNAGPSEATGIVVTDLVPAGLEVLTEVGDEVGEDWTVESIVVVDPEDASAGTRVTARYALPVAPLGTTSGITLQTRVEVAAYPEVVNVAEAAATEITDAQPDRTPGDNRVEDTVAVPPLAALVVTKTAVGAFQVGKAGAYEIVVRNDGPTADPGPVAVTDVLPDGLSFAGSPDAGVQVDGRTVSWTIEDGLDVDEEVTLTLRVDVGEAAYPSVTNVAAVQSDSEQTDDARLADDETVEVAAADPLAVTGGEMAIGVIALALLLVLAGGVLLTVRRRRGSSAEGSPRAE
ncbi:isopeptide-forming domain-containing fimbrial protein [Microbacterium sp. 179-I 3D4 NHS]|uniref:isopeptide-forming domain-containing fimbrial protein n=1 Tax=Microbacterium sp. 179-I 3D4 NHS TaxID=3142381 RepID=UPI0039A3794B